MYEQFEVEEINNGKAYRVRTYGDKGSTTAEWTLALDNDSVVVSCNCLRVGSIKLSRFGGELSKESVTAYFEGAGK